MLAIMQAKATITNTHTGRTRQREKEQAKRVGPLPIGAGILVPSCLRFIEPV